MKGNDFLSFSFFSGVTMDEVEKRGQSAGTTDLTEGPIFKKMILYALPIIFTGVLQLLFNTADIIVVGNFASETALAAVGSTGAIINLIVNLLIGLSVGAGVSAARIFGQKNDKGMEEIVHTSMLTAIVGGVLFGAVGFVFSKYFLIWINTPDNVIDQATLYVKIYCLGIPFSIVYNFGASILRAVGDTKRPLYFLVISGVINVIFNLFFVIALNMDVAGVATATVISQVISCILVVIYLMRVDGSHRFIPKNMRFEPYRFKQILLVGIPAGFQAAMFSISNLLIQSSINYFGDVVMSANAASGNIEGFIYIAMNSFYHTALTFTGQHIGAKKAEKIKKIAILCLVSVSVVGLALGIISRLLGGFLLSLYVSGSTEYENKVIEYGLTRMTIISLTYFTFGMSDVFSGLLRGMSKSFTAMIISLACICGFRILWIYTVFAVCKDLTILYLSYPISWVLCLICQLIAFIVSYKKVLKHEKAKKEAKTANQAA